MFIEFQTKDDKSIFYNVHNVVFIGEMDEQVSVLFDDGTHAIVPDEYAEVVKKVIELTKPVINPSMFVQLTTKKEERIAVPLRRIFYILEQEETTAIMFNDGTRIEVLDEHGAVLKRIYEKLNIGVKYPKNDEKSKN